MDLLRFFAILSLFIMSSQAFLFQRHPHTLNKPQLTEQYNQRISSIQEYRRPLGVKPIFGYDVAGKLNDWDINHRGQVATLENGRNFLVHKAPNAGHYSNTVVVDADANKLSNKWEKYGSSVTPGAHSSRLGDLVRAGGKRYDAFLDNCMHAACNIRNRFEKGK